MTKHSYSHPPATELIYKQNIDLQQNASSRSRRGFATSQSENRFQQQVDVKIWARCCSGGHAVITGLKPGKAGHFQALTA
ncbi:hypothetical protein AA309_05435 [Microvirga vignae]|uniref:Uncharacterized protein n=1 Tax=Microvirga vignae TaxID=1225564 RepID=A0A0H1RMQ8_9HYPH|nr:hypothetical protein AA309_05435 [Microvirga vignae]